MTALTMRDFRSLMAHSFNRVDAGERVFIRRRNQLYTIVPVEDTDLEASSELQAKIDKARQEFRDGKAITLANHQEVDAYFDSL